MYTARMTRDGYGNRCLVDGVDLRDLSALKKQDNIYDEHLKQFRGKPIRILKDISVDRLANFNQAHLLQMYSFFYWDLDYQRGQCLNVAAARQWSVVKFGKNIKLGFDGVNYYINGTRYRNRDRFRSAVLKLKQRPGVQEPSEASVTK